MSELNRIVALIDMDCFYCQVEEKENPNLKGKPVAVVQYNEWKGGGIIAVNYIARAKGVTRSMRGDEAKEKCPDIELPRVPCIRGKADISKYRDAGKEVAHVLQKFTPLLERASIDEAYLDITQAVLDRLQNYQTAMKHIVSDTLPNTFILGYTSVDSFIADVYKQNELELDISGFDQEHSLKLLIGAEIISEIRAAVYETTGYRCSAGIANNKIMSKLVCGMNKPNKQTVLPKNSVSVIFESLPLSKIKSLGGKFGATVCKILKISQMKDLLQFSEKELQKYFDEKNGSFLYNIARGIDTEPVTPRFSAKSIGCCKKFPGKTAIVNLVTLTHWLNELGDEIEDRLKTDAVEFNRRPTQMVVSFTKQLTNGKDVSSSRSINVQKIEEFCGKSLAENSLQLIKKDSKPFLSAETNPTEPGDTNIARLSHPIKFLGITVGKFEDITESKKIKNIQDFFSCKVSTQNSTSRVIDTTEIKKNNKKSILEALAGVSTDNGQHSGLSSSGLFNLLKTTKIINSTTLTKQESFFVKYLKETEPQETVTVENVDTVSSHESNSNPLDHASQTGVENEHKDDCSSDDSVCTIELEIDRSLQLPCAAYKFEEIPRPTLYPNLESDPMTNYESNIEILHSEDDQRVIFCQECNENVLARDFEIHKDYHLALSIREEDRENNKLLKNTQLKLSTGNIKKPKAISNFFKKVNISNIQNDLMEYCNECGKQIKSSDFSVHLDFHEAKKLHSEINKPIIVTKSSETIGVKRKRESNDDKKSKQKHVKSRPISTFFR